MKINQTINSIWNFLNNKTTLLVITLGLVSFIAGATLQLVFFVPTQFTLNTLSDVDFTFSEFYNNK
jgi:hypothetical protein